jgi:tetratricopeptide (TPR) repeat protein
MAAAGDGLVARAEAALDAVGRDPHAALRLADDVLRILPSRRRSDEDVRALVVAQRAAGLALREIGEAAAARARLAQALSAARSRHLTSLDAECRITGAFLASEEGRTGRALRLLEGVPDDVDPVLALRAATTRALLLQRSGRHEDCLVLYERALELARVAADPVRTARLLNNRAMALAYLGRTEAALQDLESAQQLYSSAGAETLAAQSVANAAWVAGMTGDVPGALALFDRSEAMDPGDGHAEMWADRAEVYLRAGLAVDGVRAARQAVRWLDGKGWDASQAEAELLLARCELETGALDAAKERARRCRRAFQRQQRDGWAALASYVLIVAAIRQGTARTQDVLATSARLAAAGWGLASLDVATAGAAAAQADGRPAASRALAHAAAARPRSLQGAGRHHLAAAILYESEERPREAQRALGRAFREIEARRALMGASDLRALSSTLARDVVAAGSRIAAAQRSPADAFVWAERARTAAYRYRPALPADDAELLHLLTRLRWASRAVEDALLEGRRDPDAAAEARRCEGRILQLSRRARGSTARPEPSLGMLREQLQDRAFVHVVVTGARLQSVVLLRRRAVVHDHGLADEAVAQIDRLAFSRRRVLLGGRPDEDARRRLGDLLWAPLSGSCRDLQLIVSAPPQLGQVPWGCLPGWRDQPVNVAPSARAWLDANGRSPTGTALAAIAGDGLPGALEEVAAILGARQPGAASSPHPWTAGDALAALAASDIAHVAAHARLRTDNPLFSSLRMADGDITGYDIELLAKVPHTVVLSCCRAGRDAEVAPGEAHGLATTFLRLGSASVIAPVEELPDGATTDVMTALHASLAAGSAPAAAVHAVQSDPWGPGSGLLCFGA